MSGGLNATDPGLIAEIDERINLALRKGGLDAQTMATISNLRPAGKVTLNKGIGFAQTGFVGTMLAPEVQASPDGNELAYYPVFGREMFLVGEDRVAINGAVQTSDLDMSWDSCTLDVHAHQVMTDPREERIAAIAGVDIAAKKADVAKGRVEIGKEASIATLLTTPANYGANHLGLTDGANGTAWDEYASANSDPVATVANIVEAIRIKIGRLPNTFAITQKVFKALRFHPKLQALVQYGSSKLNPSLPVGLDVLSAVFGMDMILATAIHVTKNSDTSFTDTWGNNAIICYRGEGDLYSPQFAMTLTSGGFPKTKIFEDPNRGVEGSKVYRYSDAYKAKIVHAPAGSLLSNVG